MDQKRVEEQKRFYEIARQRAKELDVYMERFRRDIVESSNVQTSLSHFVQRSPTLRWPYEAVQGNQGERANS